jgi:hypothetical protein
MRLLPAAVKSDMIRSDGLDYTKVSKSWNSQIGNYPKMKVEINVVFPQKSDTNGWSVPYR